LSPKTTQMYYLVINIEIKNHMRTREKSTLEQYRSITVRLLNSVEKLGTPPTPENVKHHVEHLVPQRGYAWLRLVKASLIEHYSQNNDPDGIELIESISSEHSKRKDLKTSAGKKKSITPAQLEKLRAHFKANVDNSKNIKPIIALVEATLIAGLRPSEWAFAQLIKSSDLPSDLISIFSDYSGDYPALLVENAKATNGRSFGKYRIIDLSGLDISAMSFINLALLYAQKYKTTNSDWDAFYQTIRCSLYNLIKAHLPSLKGVSLYTFRHQCIANLKLHYSPAEVAVMVGHGNDLTASEHYGKRKSGTSTSDLIKPNEADIPRVRQILSSKLSKRAFSDSHPEIPNA